MIEVQHLTKRYGPTTAVDDVSFRVERGEVLGFLGPNGAGKTTTMRVLTGYMPPTEGKAIVAGYDVFAADRGQAAHRLPAGDTAALSGDDGPRLPDVRRADQGRAAGERGSRVNAAMERTRVADMANRHCAKLSKGYRQRVGLAQAIMHNPEVLILDEPTAGLDPKQINETRQLIKGLGGDHTVILSTHILPEVSQTCQRVVIINKGRVVAVDTPENLTARLRGSETMFVQVDAARRRRRARAPGRPGRDAGGGVGDPRHRHEFRGQQRNGTRRAARAGRRPSSATGGACWSCGRSA